MSFIQMDGLQTQTEGISQIIPGSRIVVIGDAPCSDDFKTRKPFSGTAGTLLGQCLGTAGIQLSSLSVIFLNPTGISCAGLWTEKGGFTTIGADAIGNICSIVKSINPNVIVPLGEIPFQAVCRRSGITKYRNSMLEAAGNFTREDGTPYKVIPTLSPATAIRQYLLRYHIANDFRRIHEESFYPDIRVPARTLLVQPSFLECKAFLLELITDKKPSAFDIEVYKGEVSCISFAPDSLLSMSIPFDSRWTIEEEAELWRLIEAYLGDASIAKYLQNGMFDRSFLLMRNKIIVRGIVHDTMIKCHLNYPDFPKGLGFICSLFTREPYYKDDGKTWFNDIKGSGHNNINQFYEYNAKDSAVLLEADPLLQDELVKFGNAETYDFCRRLMEPLLFMATRGIKVNKDKLQAHKVEATASLEKAQIELNKLCGFALNVSSPKQCKEYFYGVKGYKPITALKKDPVTGERSSKATTDNKAMKKLALKGCKEATLVQQVRAYRKLIGTYLNISFDSDGRLRCSWNISGTNSGRLSSSATIFGTGTNMQNLPKIFKAFLEADEGYLMCEMDKAQAEWVVVAYLCGDANMIRTIENREDAHINTAHLMFGAPKELIKLEDEILGSESDESVILQKRKEYCPDILRYHPIPNMSCRQAGKKSNHGLNYDLGANGFAATYGLDLREARRCCDLYHRAYPSIRIWHAHIRTQLGKDRTLVNLFGRKRRFLDRWGDDLFKAAYAYIPQSTVAQLLNKALIDCYEKQTLPDFEFLRKLELLSQVHDSVLWQRILSDLRGYAQCMLAIKEFAEVPLVANGRSFIIRTDAKVGFDAKNLEKVSIEGTLDEVTANLEQVVAKLLEKQKQTSTAIDLDELEDSEDDEVEEG